MAIQRERLNRKNASGEYDTIHLETQADLVLITSDSSKNVEQVLGETVTIARGGTGATTAAAGLYALANELPVITSDDLAEDDCICFVDADVASAKLIAIGTITGAGGSEGGEGEPTTDWMLGNIVEFGHEYVDNRDVVYGNPLEWVVCHIDGSYYYLALNGVSGSDEFNHLKNLCRAYLSEHFTAEEKLCMHEVTAGNTSGQVFVATRKQMEGEFSYFISNERRIVSDPNNFNGKAEYHTSSERSTFFQYIVDSTGEVTSGRMYDGSDSSEFDNPVYYDFRPFICIDMNLYTGGSEPTDPAVPDINDLYLGNTVSWADNIWIVCHVTDTEAYLITANIVDVTDSRWDDACAGFYDTYFTEEMRTALKPVYANTEYIWIPSYDQLTGGFDYFNSDSRRACGNAYHTCTYIPPNYTSHYIVTADGSFDRIQNLVSDIDGNSGLRPIICIDLTTYS